MIEKWIKLYRYTVLFSSIICLGFLLYILIKEKHFASWQQLQTEYKNILDANNSLEKNFLKSIRQITLPDLQIVDRCTSCHLGVEYPFLKDIPSPFKIHSGDYLKIHPVEKFGCTRCHRGKGRVLKVQEVCTSYREKTSLYSQNYLQASCGKCHLAIYEENLPIEGTEILLQGLKIFHREGCLGCHKARKVGGSLGPDLTDQGNKLKSAYDFRYVTGEKTVPNWLRLHFIDPETVSPGSQMLNFDLPEGELDALITFTLGLFKPTLPLEYYSFANLREFKSRRKLLKGTEVYGLFCAACHGKAGEGKDYEKYKTGVTSLNNPDLLAVVSPEFIEFTIQQGRGKRQMASWRSELSGLSDSEIERVVEFIQEWRLSAPEFDVVKAVSGNIQTGIKVYLKWCSMCHGESGEGVVAPAINNQDFLSIATDEFLYCTIVSGRRNTAMPSWSRLKVEEMSSLLKFLRTWQKTKSIKLPSEPVKGNAQRGDLLFHNLCERCHGKFGSGGIGPAILNRDFLTAASDQFLYTSISRGRNHTAMFGWETDLGKPEKLSENDIQDIVSYMKSRIDSVTDVIYPGESLGKPGPGKTLYLKYCSKCHGYNGEGDKAPALNNQEFLNAATNGFILATISLGRAGTAMPTWGKVNEKNRKLSGAERQDIIAYIRGWQVQVIRKRSPGKQESFTDASLIQEISE
jgi:mono/diheme cytochrome c family protein